MDIMPFAYKAIIDKIPEKMQSILIYAVSLFA